MSDTTVSSQGLTATTKRLGRRLLFVGENRVQLLTVELQQEIEHFLHLVLLAMAVSVFGMLAGIALSAAVVIHFWAHSPAAVFLILTGVYGLIALGLSWQLNTLMRGWRTFAGSLDQFRKDCACFEKILL